VNGSQPSDEMFSQLVPSADPPLPNRANPIRKVAASEVRDNIKTAISVGLPLAAVAAILLYFGLYTWAGTVGLFLLVFFFATFSAGQPRASCPYCSGELSNLGKHLEGKDVQCQRCFEYSLVRDGSVHALDPDKAPANMSFEAPLYQETRWPRACVACGAPPTRLDELSTSGLSAAHLAAGRVRWTSVKVGSVPYCDAHRGVVRIKIRSDRTVRLLWPSLRMLRRYLAANRQTGRQL